MSHEELVELLKTDKPAFVLAFLDELGGLTPRNVEEYTPSRYSKKPLAVHEFAITKVDGEGGHEGDGEYMDAVFQIASTRDGVADIANALFFRVTGTYNSWDSSEWDDVAEIVEQREVLVKQWFTI